MRRARALHAPCSSFVESAVRACAFFEEAIFASIGIIPGFQAYPQPPGSLSVLKSMSPEAAAFPTIGGKAVTLARNFSGPIRLGLRHSGCSAGIEIVASERFEPGAVVRAREPKRHVSRQDRAVHHVRNAFIASRDDRAPYPMKAREVAAECGTPSSGLFPESRRDGLASLSKRFRKWHARRPKENPPFPGEKLTREGMCPCRMRGDREGCSGESEKFALAKQ